MTTNNTPEEIARQIVEKITAPEYAGYQQMTAVQAKNELYRNILAGLLLVNSDSDRLRAEWEAREKEIANMINRHMFQSDAQGSWPHEYGGNGHEDGVHRSDCRGCELEKLLQSATPILPRLLREEWESCRIEALRIAENHLCDKACQIENGGGCFACDSIIARGIRSIPNPHADKDGICEKHGRVMLHDGPCKECRRENDGCHCKECAVRPHLSSCSVHNMPAFPNGPCDCKPADKEAKP